MASRRKTAVDLDGVLQPEPTDQNRAMLRHDGAQRVPVFGRPAGRVAGGVGSQDRRLARLQFHIEQ